MTLTAGISIVLSYALGCVSPAYWVGKSVGGIDLRSVGSGNLGATNAGRALGRKWGFVVYALDFLKGALPVLAGRFLLGDPVLGETVHLAVVMGCAAIVGHCLPIQFRFRGGKGVATASGAVLILHPLVALLAAVVFAAALRLTRMMAVGSCVGAVTVPVAYGLLTPIDERPRLVLLIVFSLLAVLVLIRHHTNLARILEGTEPRIGDKIT